MSAAIIPLEPKSKSGRKRNVGWTVNYNTTTRKFQWTVTVAMEPQVFTGECGTMAEAETKVNSILSKFK